MRVCQAEPGNCCRWLGGGWHSETAIQLFRLIVSAVLDRLPKLQVIVGHMGEAMPFALALSNWVFSSVTQGRRGLAEVMKEQVQIYDERVLYATSVRVCAGRDRIGADNVFGGLSVQLDDGGVGLSRIAGAE